MKNTINTLTINQLHNPLTMRKLHAIEFQPYYRSANIEKCSEFKRIPANKERVKKAGRVVVICSTKFTKTPVRITVRTKAEYVAAFKAAQFITGKNTTKKVKVVPMVEEPLKLKMKHIRRVMRTLGKGTFLKVWKITNNKNDVVKYFVNREKAREYVRNCKKFNIVPTTKPIN